MAKIDIVYKINSVKNKYELYFNGVPYSSIPIYSYAGYEAWVSHDKPNTPFWVEIYTKDRDYIFAFDKKEKWIMFLHLINEWPIIS